MRFKLWIYKSDGFIKMAVEDTEKKTYGTGAWKLRDQSNYSGQMVWKDAKYPASVEHTVHEVGGFVVAESDNLAFLDARTSSKVLNSMWNRRNG